ncbi:MAG: polyribonucleotide nucleotidyltransferase, partial [Syntrophales bacterium]
MSKDFRCDFAGREICLKTDYVAAQADGAVFAQYGDTVVLVTAVSLKTAREGLDFLPLTVDYQEKTFAAGKIPGGFFKREGKLNEREILLSRIIDRSIRPLIQKGYFFETQIVATVLSVDDENDSDVVAMLGASAALTLSNIPFQGPIAGVRVGRLNGAFICNPSHAQQAESDLNLFLVGRKVLPGTEGRPYDVNLVMLEGEAREVDEDTLVDAINFGLESLRPVIDLQEQIRQEIGRPKRVFVPPAIDPDLAARVEAAARPGFTDGYATAGKLDRYAKLDEIRAAVVKEFTAEAPDLKSQVLTILEHLERKILRGMILHEKKRSDGRSATEIRPIRCDVGILPRAHGSGLFTRGETQALAALTLGTSSDEQRLDFIGGEEMRSFILHYNFPPYSVAEAKSIRGPGRREIGHGNLARRALLPVLPAPEVFPYTIRIVSEILASNGSSSMATVCAGVLSLMDGGVPVKDVVAGIAMGLLKEGDEV